MKITKAKLKQIIQEELSSLSEADEYGHFATEADPRGISEPLTTGAVTFDQWRLEVLDHLPHMHDAWTMNVAPEEYANNLKAELSMEAPTDPEAMAYARGEI